MRLTLNAVAALTMATMSLMHTLPATAQSYPTKRITLIVPLPAGASSDGIARIYAEKLKDRLGQPVIVENRVGNGGVIGLDALAKSAPDGYTLGLLSQVIVTPRGLLQNASFDGTKDFALFGRVSSSPFVIVAPAETGVKTLSEFVNLAKSKPGALNYGVVPNSLMQIDMVRFMQANQVKIQEVPFNGAAPIATALLSNQIQMSFIGTSGFPHFKTGKLIPLAVTSTDGMVRRLGGAQWRKLHMLVYPAGIAGVIHYFLMIKAGFQQPLLYAVILTALFGVRLYKRA